jgi:hypothetical protein
MGYIHYSWWPLPPKYPLEEYVFPPPVIHFYFNFYSPISSTITNPPAETPYRNSQLEEIQKRQVYSFPSSPCRELMPAASRVTLFKSHPPSEGGNSPRAISLWVSFSCKPLTLSSAHYLISFTTERSQLSWIHPVRKSNQWSLIKRGQHFYNRDYTQ